MGKKILVSGSVLLMQIMIFKLGNVDIDAEFKSE